MTMIALAFDPSALQLHILVWPVLFGLGAYLFLTAQPVGCPKPDLAQRLRRLDVDERIRAEIHRQDARPIFASRLLEGMLRPVLDDLGRIIRSILARFGLAGGRELGAGWPSSGQGLSCRNSSARRWPPPSSGSLSSR